MRSSQQYQVLRTRLHRSSVPTTAMRVYSYPQQLSNIGYTGFNNAPAVHGAPNAQKEFESVAPIIEWMKHESVDFGT